MSVFSLAYGISQLPAGWIADRIGPRLLILVGISGVALFGLLLGLSQTYVMMLVFMVLMGVAAGGYHPSAPPLISATVDAKKRGRAFGIHMIGGSASYFLAPLAGVAIAAVWGWRGSFITFAIPTIILGVVVYIIIGRRMASQKGKAEVEREIEVEVPEEKPVRTRLRHLVAFILLSAVISAVIQSIIDFVPLLMVDRFGVAKETAAFFIALFFSCGIWVCPIGGILSDRFNKARMLMVIGLFGSILMYFFKFIPYGISFGAFLIALGIIVYARMPVSENFIISHTSKRHRSTVLGIYYFSGMEGVGILMPILGNIIDRYGFSTALDIASGAILATVLVCSALLWDSRG